MSGHLTYSSMTVGDIIHQCKQIFEAAMSDSSTSPPNLFLFYFTSEICSTTLKLLVQAPLVRSGFKVCELHWQDTSHYSRVVMMSKNQFLAILLIASLAIFLVLPHLSHMRFHQHSLIMVAP
ncbi:hypothetical protein KP509_08G046100 [Ceratopteris richardii]|uniref:Uncharacterized protein n=1 Tax=Ceratopteris richardii TaxID=49495 RepID=A0A8T2UA52_CERRI|nr:hypothetical protein KP509_08G046100 [Ceratopteris richardii]